ncbi:MAG: hypothetical protein HYZ53_04720 [Planctomycetes bacterium]|nr:hypothetical protein [Planctomycetota bacterium]
MAEYEEVRPGAGEADPSPLQTLHATRADLRRRLTERPADAALQVELGIVEKLLGEIDLAFELLGGALARLPPDDRATRQRGLFVLGLTYGDVRRPREAVACFEAAARVDPAAGVGQAAQYYAETYRRIFGVEGAVEGAVELPPGPEAGPSSSLRT